MKRLLLVGFILAALFGRAQASVGTMQLAVGGTCGASGTGFGPFFTTYLFVLNWQTFSFSSGSYLPTPCRDIYGSQSSPATLVLGTGHTAGLSWITNTGSPLLLVSDLTAQLNGSANFEYLLPNGGQEQFVYDGTNWSLTGAAKPVVQTLAVAANAQVGLISGSTYAVLPKNATIQAITLRETAGNAVTLSIGTSSGGAQIVSAYALSASTSVTIGQASATMLASWFSASSTQAIYISSALWNSASVNVTVYYQVGQ
jgi:hypothetical protein